MTGSDTSSKEKMMNYPWVPPVYKHEQQSTLVFSETQDLHKYRNLRSFIRASAKHPGYIYKALRVSMKRESH